MFSESDPGMFWLNVTNFALGALVAFFWLVVLGALGREMVRRLTHRAVHHRP